MGLRSQNNPIASFRDVFSATGTDSSAAAASGPNAPGEQWYNCYWWCCFMSISKVENFIEHMFLLALVHLM